MKVLNEYEYNGSGSGDNENFNGDGSNVGTDQELDSDDEDYVDKDFYEGSGNGKIDFTYDGGNEDSIPTGNVSTLSQEEMEQIR